MDVQNKRYPVVAGVMAFLMVGMGHMYCGQFKRGCIIALAILGFNILINIIAAAIGGSAVEYSSYILIPGVILVFIWQIVDAVKIAKKTPQIILKPYNNFLMYLLYFLLLPIICGLIILLVTILLGILFVGAEAVAQS